MKGQLHPAYLLHSRPYRNSSIIANFLTHQYGRIDAVVRGVRSQRNKQQTNLPLFAPLLIAWSGNASLVTIQQYEINGHYQPLQGKQLFYGMYVNELLLRLLAVQDQHQRVFTHYDRLLKHWQQRLANESDLRFFELEVVSELGYGLDLQHDSLTGQAIAADKWYQFIPEQGLSELADNLSNGFYGEHLIALQQRCLKSKQQQRTAKHLMRQVVGYLLGDKPLKSRDLFL